MQKYTDAPDSAAWHARRARCFNAGDAPAMLSCSPNMTRSQLLHEIHTGLQREFSDYVQEHVLDPGHAVEAALRPIAEEILGEELQVLAGTLDVEGLSRPLGASLDGITFMEDTDWECKRLNEELRAALPHSGRDSHQRNDGKALPKDKRVQMEQQMCVTGATRTLFSAGDLNERGEIIDERHAWYYSDPALRAEILAGWRQFDTDLAAYVPPSPAAVQKIVAEPVEALPAPVIQVTGQLALTDNFKVFEERLRQFLEERLIREPKTDQDFADLDQQIRAMKQARESLKAAGAQMLAQVEPVEQATKKQEMLDKLLQQNLSVAERLLKDEKERRRGEIVAGGVGALKAHIEALNTRLGKPYMPAVPADFGGVVKGLKSLASMEDKVAAELARAKIAANEVADRIQANLATLRELASKHAFLFADTALIVLKAPEDLTSLAKNRVAEHQASEARKEEEQREQIRKEEAERVEREQAERNRMAMSEIQGIQQQVVIAQIGRQGVRKGGTVDCIRETLAETEAWTIDEERFGALTGMAQQAKDAAVSEIRALLTAAEQPVAATAPAQGSSPAASPAAAVTALSATPTTASAAAPTVIPMPARAAIVPTGKPSLSLGQLKERIAPLQITADGMATLGFTGLKDRGSVLFHESDYPHILAAIVAHVQAIQAKQAA